MTNAKLREQGIDGTELDACATAGIPQFGGIDVIPAVGHQKRQCGEPVDDFLGGTRTNEALKQFLQDQATGDNGVFALQRIAQRNHLGAPGGGVAAKGQRPNTGIDEQGHYRDRSAL